MRYFLSNSLTDVPRKAQRTVFIAPSLSVYHLCNSKRRAVFSLDETLVTGNIFRISYSCVINLFA